MRFTGYFPVLLLLLIAGTQLSCNRNDEQKLATAKKINHVKATPLYNQDVQPIFNHRCIACHGCIGSPCNLKLDSFRAVERGALARNPYSTHFEAYLRTGMDVVQTTEQWRRRGFFPVLFRDGSTEKNLKQSLLYTMLATGYHNNKPGFSREVHKSSYKNRF